MASGHPLFAGSMRGQRWKMGTLALIGFLQYSSKAFSGIPHNKPAPSIQMLNPQGFHLGSGWPPSRSALQGHCFDPFQPRLKANQIMEMAEPLSGQLGCRVWYVYRDGEEAAVGWVCAACKRHQDQGWQEQKP